MSNVSINAVDLMLALDIEAEEAEGILSGDLEFDEGELAKIAVSKGVPLEEVEEYFMMCEQ